MHNVNAPHTSRCQAKWLQDLKTKHKYNT